MRCEYPSPATLFPRNDYSLNSLNSLSAEISNDNQLPTLNLLDLQLLHNFSTATCATLHRHPFQQTLWRINIPQIGFSYDFVMRGILAISALHLAYLCPEKKGFYTSQALVHHQISLSTAIPLLSHVTPENCSALYTFAILASIFSLGRPRTPEDSLVVEEAGVVTWLTLLRGTRSIIESSHTAVRSGPLGPMFQNELRRVQLRDMPSYNHSIEEKQLEELQRTIAKATTDQRILKTYTEAIEELRKSYMVLYNNPHTYEFTDVFIWVLRASDEYLQLLNEQTQESLCIFAFFSVVLYQLRSHWWIEGWGSNLIAQIYLLLDEEHRWWIQWPLEQVHWVANPEGQTD